MSEARRPKIGVGVQQHVLFGGDSMRDIELLNEELLNEIKRKLDQARDLATEAGGFTLFYLIEMALMETGEMEKKHKIARHGHHELSGAL
jgi:hypothetical protein